MMASRSADRRLAWRGPAALAAALGLALLLSGCGSLVQIASGGPVDLYTLTPKGIFLDDLPVVDWQLVVEEPIAAGGLASNRIAVRPSPNELKYFAGAQWAERAPKMVQTLLVASLEDSGRIVAVGRQAIGLRADYSLKIELREFQAEYFDAQGAKKVPGVRVRLSARLLRHPKQQIIASRSFERMVPADASNMRAVVTAFDQALGPVMRELVEWVLTSPGQEEGDAG